MTTSARNNNKVILEKPNVPLFQRYISEGLRTHIQVILLLPSSQSPFPAIKIKCPLGGLKMKAIIILKISSIFICQRYAIDGLFQEFDICFVVFTETFLVLYFFSTSSPTAIAVIFFTGIRIFLDNPKIVQMLSILGEKLGWRKKKKQQPSQPTSIAGIAGESNSGRNYM